MDRAYSVLEIKELDEDARVISGIASTPSTDRVGDIVESMGAKFALPLPLLFHHDSKQPVGHVEFAEAKKSGIPFRARIAKTDEPGRLKDRLDEAWHSVKAGLIRGVSIGFKSTKHEMMKDGGIHFQEWSWLELSLVTIPANQDATITQIRSIDTELRAATGREQDVAEKREEKPGASGRKDTNPRKGVRTMPKTVAEQISAFEATRQAKAARMDELMEKAAETGETLDTAQSEEYDGIANEVKSIDEHLVRLADLEKSNALKAKAVERPKNPEEASQVRGGAVVSSMKDNLPPGIEFARYAMCLATAKGNTSQALEIAAVRYPDQPRIQTTLKAAVAAGTTTHVTWASPLVDYQQFAGDFVEFLRPQTIIGKFGVGNIPSLRRVPFNIQIAGQTSGGDGYWVGEGAPKPLTKFDFNRITLRWAKVANIAVLTEELVRFSNPSAEMLVRDSLAAAIIARIDQDFVDPAKVAVADISPASITYGVSPIVSSGDDIDAVRADMYAIVSAMITANVSGRAVWLMSENTALALSIMMNPLGQPEFPGLSDMGGMFFGRPVITSQYIDTETVILMIPNEIFLADDGQVVIDVSREASLQMDNAPTNNSATPTATSLVSLWQTNSVGLRAERWINWQRRRLAAVQYLNDVAWGGTGSPS